MINNETLNSRLNRFKSERRLIGPADLTIKKGRAPNNNDFFAIRLGASS